MSLSEKPLSDQARINVWFRDYNSVAGLYEQHKNDAGALTQIAAGINLAVDRLHKEGFVVEVDNLFTFLNRTIFRKRTNIDVKALKQNIIGKIGFRFTSETLPRDVHGGSWAVTVQLKIPDQHTKYQISVWAGCHKDESPERIIQYWATSRRVLTPNRREHYIPEVLKQLARAAEEAGFPEARDAAKEQLQKSLEQADRLGVGLRQRDREKVLAVLSK